MNWIDISKQRPEAEPHRQVLFKTRSGYFTNWTNFDQLTGITHWAEIEGPDHWPKLKLPHSTDARDWSKAFVEIVKENPTIPSDAETMTTWFANAIMAGVDEAERRHRAKPPPPDPFKEWWGGIRDRYIMVICGNAMIKEGAARHIWDAAIKWKAGFKP